MFRLYTLVPSGYRRWVEDYILYSNIDIKPTDYINFIFLLGIILPTIATFSVVTFGILPLKFAIFFIWFPTFIVFIITFHFILVFTADKRAEFTEEVLPDALQLISSNIRSGLTVDRAILTSARPEFGPLEQELKRVAKETISGKSLEESLKTIPKRIKSRLLDRTINLLVEGISKGGNMANLLDNIAEDVRQAKTLRREIKSYVMMYAIFIFFAVGIGAPLLYSISTFLVQTMAKFGTVETPGITVQTNLPLMKFQGVEISPQFLLKYSIAAIAISAIFGSLLIGLINEGTEKAGVKLIPILVTISLGLFWVARIVIGSIFSALVA